MFPLVPGHEFVGVVSAVGAAVTKFRVGDAVAIGNIVDSCGECKWCLRGQESWCEEIPTQTYSGEDRHDGTRTFGGCSGEYVARDRFVYHRPTTLDPAGVAPLLCAGITVWDPLRAEEAGPGTRGGAAGIGGPRHPAGRLAPPTGGGVAAVPPPPTGPTGARWWRTVALRGDHRLGPAPGRRGRARHPRRRCRHRRARASCRAPGGRTGR